MPPVAFAAVLGIGIILVGVLMGATTGIVGATVVTLGLLTLPTLLRRKYDKGLRVRDQSAPRALSVRSSRLASFLSCSRTF